MHSWIGRLLLLSTVYLLGSCLSKTADDPGADSLTASRDHLTVVSGATAEDDDPHMMGLIPPSEEELAWIRDMAISPEKIKPSHLAIERVAQDRIKRGLAPISQQELELAWRRAPKRGSSLRTIPSSVDNSQLQAFPPVRSQGNLGSCASFSTTYYLLTHEVALRQGWDAKNGGNDYRFSPKWTYNFVNDGDNGGSTISAPFGIFRQNGAATWQQFPYSGSTSPATNYRQWCLDTDTWRSAIQYRIDQTGSVLGLDKATGLDALRRLLTNGHVLVYTTYITSWQFLSGGLKDDSTTTDDDQFVGQAVCHWMNGYNGPHAMTIVGYNDSVWVDINGNDVVDAGEKGALKIANSWGTGWKNGGFAWIAYDALKSVSAVDGAPSNGRVSAFSSAIWITPKEHYHPVMTAELTVNSVKRDQMLITMGRGEVGDPEPSVLFYPNALRYAGGPYSFDGTTTPVQASFVVDMTDVTVLNESKRYFLNVRDRTAGDATDVLGYKIVDHVNAAELSASDLPQTVDDDNIYSWIDYLLPSTNTPPSISSISDQVLQVNTDVENIAFTVQDAETPASELVLRAESSSSSLVMVPDIVFGGSGGDRTVSIYPVPFATGSSRITIFVSDGIEDTRTSFWLHVTATNNTPPTLGPIADQSTQAGVATPPIPFSVGDAETPLDELDIQLMGSGLLGYEITGQGADRQLRLCPSPVTLGDQDMTLWVSDGELEATSDFVLSVAEGPANTAPTISSIPDQTTNSGVPVGPIPFTIGDAQTDPAFLMVWYDTMNWDLVGFNSMHIDGEGSDRILTICPTGGKSGVADINMTVSDGELDSSTSFRLTVADTGNTPPTISAIDDQVIPVNSTTGPLDFTLGDAETTAEFLYVNVGSSDWTLIPWNGIVMEGEGALRTITVTPNHGLSGSATITLNVPDGTESAMEQFLLTVDPDLKCGNHVMDDGETCDPPETCPVTCDDGDPCTSDNMLGSAATCDASCDNAIVDTCQSQDACCPAACNANNDDDCAPVCGNSIVEPAETCDPPESCPASCDDSDACTSDSSTGASQDCDLQCLHSSVDSCVNADGCCPGTCNANNDDDCTPVCGNNVLEQGETCDPPDSCPASCDDSDACTSDALGGSAQDCTAECVNTTIESCVDGDGCCPGTCNHATDSDCSPSCGDGILDPGETCDPPQTCPGSCDDSDACTTDTLTGSVQNCNAECSHAPVDSCTDGDGCCPEGCVHETDNDCEDTQEPDGGSDAGTDAGVDAGSDGGEADAGADANTADSGPSDSGTTDKIAADTDHANTKIEGSCGCNHSSRGGLVTCLMVFAIASISRKRYW